MTDPAPRPSGPGPAGPPGRARAAIALALVLAVVVVAGLVLTRDRSGPAPIAAPAPTPASPGSPSPGGSSAAGGARLAVFRGTDPAAVAEYERWLGRDVDLVVDFSTRDSWKQIEAPDAMLKAWASKPYRQVYSVGLLPEKDASATVERGAAGDYDGHFRELARRLVEAGQQDAIIRLGWEFNLEGSRWSTPDEKAFVAYWRRVVAAMRAQPGSAFRFDWNPNNGRTPYDAVDYYPGDDVVDLVGVDAYDVSFSADTYPYPARCDADCRRSRQELVWNREIYGGSRGLRFWSAFAARHGKPMSIPEWGLWGRADGHGGGENTYYLDRMADFVADPANNVAYQSYFEFDGADGVHRLMVDFPGSAAAFRARFGS
jgi:Glycosyl hydrolase family 26